MENSLTTDVHKPELLGDPKETLIPKWNVIFIVSCVFAVFLDPLFLYIPLVNEDIKCLRLDNNLKIAALVLRSATDLCYLLNIFFQVYSSNIPELKPECPASRSGSYSTVTNILMIIANATRRTYVLIDILAVLPLPQVVILKFFCKVEGSGSFSTRTLINFLILAQYVPRVFRIYLSCQESKKSSTEGTPIWLKGLLNFFLYILASHVLGAFWYFFAVQRITSCWQYGCRKENGCDPNNLECHDHHASRNITFLNDVCSIHPPDENFFDFGIYLDILQLGILGSTNYPEKFSNCFWWGLRNLSSLGSNLKPSINTWENLFAAFISINGLLLFLYLIGNLQTYMQLETTRMEKRKWKNKIEKKMEEIGEKVDVWLSNNGIPLRKKSKVMEKVQAQLEEKKDVKVENIVSILPSALRRELINFTPLYRLTEVPLLRNMDKKVLIEISKHLKPKKYTKNYIIIAEDEPLEMMIFIVDGLVIVEMEGWSGKEELVAGQFYGEKLLSWPAWTSSPGKSDESVRAFTDVEVLALMASDIESVGSKFRSCFDEKITLQRGGKWERLTSDKVTMLRKVPIFQTMDSYVLKDISRHLRRFTCSSDNYIIREAEPLEKMFFLVDGSSLSIESSRSSPLKRESLDMGEFYGEELVHWVTNWSSHTIFPDNLPLSTSSLKVTESVDVCVLTADDLRNIVLKFMPHFMKQTTLPLDSQGKLSTFDALTSLKKVPNLKNMDEEILRTVCEHLKQMKYDDKSPDIINSGEKKLDKMFLIVSGLVSIKNMSGRRTYCYSGNHYGDELFTWAVSLTSLTDYALPKSDVCVEAVGDVEALLLMADDLVTVVSKFKSQFKITQTDSDVGKRRIGPRKMIGRRKMKSLVFYPLLDEEMESEDEGETNVSEKMLRRPKKTTAPKIKASKLPAQAMQGAISFDPGWAWGTEMEFQGPDERGEEVIQAQTDSDSDSSKSILKPGKKCPARARKSSTLVGQAMKAALNFDFDDEESEYEQNAEVNQTQTDSDSDYGKSRLRPRLARARKSSKLARQEMKASFFFDPDEDEER